MFDDMDTDRSGIVTRDEMRDNLTLLGLDVDDNTAVILVEDIDIDHSGDIDVSSVLCNCAYLPLRVLVENRYTSLQRGWVRAYHCLLKCRSRN